MSLWTFSGTIRSVGPTALGVHVSIVVLDCSEEKVVRIHALAVIAPMADEHPLWNGAACKLVGYAMCSNHGPTPRDLAVPLMIQRAEPKPATGVGFRD